MAKSQFSLAFLLLPALLVVGCSKSSGGGSYKSIGVDEIKGGKIDEATPANVFPLVVGNSWTYDVSQRTVANGQAQEAPPSSVTFTVTAAKTDTNGDQIGEVEIRNSNDEVSEIQKWRINKEGLFMYSSGKPSLQTAFTPPSPFVKFPLKKNEVFAWNGNGPAPTTEGKAVNYKGTLKFIGDVVADTMVGQYNALQLMQTQTWTLGPEQLKQLHPNGVPKPTDPNQGMPPTGETKPADPKPESAPPVGETTAGSEAKPAGEDAEAELTKAVEDPTKGISASVIYISPKVGIVRFRQELRISDRIFIVQTFKLKSTTVK